MNRTVKLRTVLVVVGVLVVLPGTFYAGMSYENHRITTELEEAFSGFGEGSSESEESDGSNSYGEAIPLGEAVSWFPTDGEMWTVSLGSVECDLETIPGAAENPKYYDSENAPEYIDAEAPSGQMFCIVTSDWQNTGKTPASLESYTTMNEVVTADGTEFSANQDDETASGILTPELTDTLNPGRSVTVRNVYTLDEGIEVDAVSLKAYEMMSEVPSLLFDAS